MSSDYVQAVFRDFIEVGNKKFHTYDSKEYRKRKKLYPLPFGVIVSHIFVYAQTHQISHF